MTDSNLLGPLLQGFFLEHLLQHKHASPCTVAAYRDSFRLLLTFLHKTTGTEPAKLRVTDLDATSVLTFLDHLERERLNTVRSRNARLAAIRSFFRYVALHAPERLALVNQVLAVPQKRPERKLLGYLTRMEMDALLAAPDCSSWVGRRDHALLLCLYNTGARVSEIISVQRADICLDAEPSLQLRGKGRKERQVPLWTKTARVLRKWLGELAAAALPFVFPNARGGALARHGVAFIIAQNVQRASSACPSLALRKVSPHTIRHTTAMHLLQAGVAPAIIALWLGHESIETTHTYIEADLEMKRRTLEKLPAAGQNPRSFKPSDNVLAFLEGL